MLNGRAAKLVTWWSSVRLRSARLNFMNYKFTPQARVVGELPWFGEHVVRAEPMLFSADVRYASAHGGDLTNAFIKACGMDPIANDWIIDSKVCMLMPGMYPCIPGWHHDDIPRDRADGQPDYDNMSYRAEHVMAIIDKGTGSLTEFVSDAVEVKHVPVGKVVYREWDKAINRLKPATWSVKSGQIVYFTGDDFHRGVPAVGHGWRWFIRASRNTKRPVMNEIRRQVQVYMPAVTSGW